MLGNRLRVAARVILVICAIGAYTVGNGVFDLVTMLVLGVIGSVFDKLNHPFATLLPAFVPGAMAASSLRQSTIGGAGTVVAVSSAAPLIASVMAIVALSWPALSRPVRMARRTSPGLVTP